MEENYAVFDIEKKEVLSRIMDSQEEAKEFRDLMMNKNARVIKFDWSVL